MRWLLPFGLFAVLAADFKAAGAADLTEPEMRAGRKLFVAKCARCHKLYDPAGYADAEWRDWMARMSLKAKLKSGQTELLSRYLDSLRSQTNKPPATGPKVRQ